MTIVKKPKVNAVYSVSNNDLGIVTIHGVDHNVVVTSINKKRGIAYVKTITSLENRVFDKYSKKYVYKFINKKLTDVRNGNILVVPKNVMRTQHLSGIVHDIKIVPLSKLNYKHSNDTTVFPNRYKQLIKRK